MTIAVAATACASQSRTHVEHATAHHAEGLLANLVAVVAESAVDAALNGAPQEGEEDATPSKAVDVVPVTLDRDFVAFALDPVKSALARCGAGVTISVAVLPDGEISKLDIPAPPDVQRCVASALRDVRFVATVRGARFHYAIPAAE
ncbi:MAG TPA: hypothetical protein VGG74_16455 [Kofleriaceae bacterium]